MKKKFLITALVGMLLAFNVCAVSARNMDFDDLPKSHWAYETIMQLSDENVIDGFDNNTFEPEEKVTREQFIKLLVCATHEVENDLQVVNMSDVNSSWAYNYIGTAQKDSIIQDCDYENGLFYPQTNLDRVTAATWIYNSLNVSTDDIKTKIFEDVSDSKDDAVVSTLYSLGIINGYEDGNFHPDDTLTRAEAAMLIEKIMQYNSQWDMPSEESNIIEYNENAFTLPKATNVNIISENSTNFCKVTNVSDELANCKVGDVIIFPASDSAPTGMAVKVKNVKRSKDNIEITKDNDIKLSEIADKIDFNKSAKITASDIIKDELPKGITVKNTNSYALLNKDMDMNTLTADKSEESGALATINLGNNDDGYFVIGLDNKLELPYGLSVNGELVVKNINIRPYIDYDHKRDGEIPNIMLNIDTEFEPNISVSFSKEFEKDIEIGELGFETFVEPFTISGKIILKINAEGKISTTVNYYVQTSGSFQYRPTYNIRPTYKNNLCVIEQLEQPEAEIKATITPKIEADLKFALLESSVLSVGPKVESGVEISTSLNNQPHSCDICIDNDFKPYIDFDVEVECATLEWDWTVYKKEFNLFEYYISHNNDKWEYGAGKCPYLQQEDCQGKYALKEYYDKNINSEDAYIFDCDNDGILELVAIYTEYHRKYCDIYDYNNGQITKKNFDDGEKWIGAYDGKFLETGGTGGHGFYSFAYDKKDNKVYIVGSVKGRMVLDNSNIAVYGSYLRYRIQDNEVIEEPRYIFNYIYNQDTEEVSNEEFSYLDVENKISRDEFEQGIKDINDVEIIDILGGNGGKEIYKYLDLSNI